MSPIAEHLWAAELSRALCLTFLHSLWQALLLALLAAFVIQLSPKSKPGKRYNVLALLLGVFAIGSGITFMLCYGKGSTGNIYAGTADTAADPALFALWHKTTVLTNTYSGQLAVLWFLAFSLKSFRLLQDLSGLHRLRRDSNLPGDLYWTRRLETLKERLKIRTRVQLRESASIYAPSVSGILKPMILLPLGMLSQLPADQIEAVLLHELAHIRRKDYLVNLAQAALEAIFFFNPFLHWLSARLKAEREHCCDAVALEVSGNKAALVKALLSFGQARAGRPTLAMAIGGRKTPLLDRVKRIASNRNKSLDATEKSFLALFSIAILTFLLTFSWNIQQLNSKANEEPEPLLRHDTRLTPEMPPTFSLQTASLKAAQQQGRITRTVCRSSTPAHTEMKTTVITTINTIPGTDTLALSRHIITDLTREGVVAEARLLSYRLNDEELVVNGVKQPESLHRKLKSKYVKCPGWAILYDFHTTCRQEEPVSFTPDTRITEPTVYNFS